MEKKWDTCFSRRENTFFVRFFLPGKTLLDALEVETGMALFLAMTVTLRVRVFICSLDPIKGSYMKTQNFRRILSFFVRSLRGPPPPLTGLSYMGLRGKSAAAAET